MPPGKFRYGFSKRGGQIAFTASVPLVHLLRPRCSAYKGPLGCFRSSTSRTATLRDTCPVLGCSVTSNLPLSHPSPPASSPAAKPSSPEVFHLSPVHYLWPVPRPVLRTRRISRQPQTIAGYAQTAASKRYPAALPPIFTDTDKKRGESLRRKRKVFLSSLTLLPYRQLSSEPSFPCRVAFPAQALKSPLAVTDRLHDRKKTETCNSSATKPAR